MRSSEPSRSSSRPTGGGIAFHGSDVSLAVIIPRSLRLSLETLMRAVCQNAVLLCEAYGAAATCVLDAKSEGPITYCLAQPAPYAVYVGDRKVAGFALRRYPESWLIQGSLLIRPLADPLVKSLPADVMEQLSARSAPLAETAEAPMTEEDVMQRWSEHWSSWWAAQMSADDYVDARGFIDEPLRLISGHQGCCLRSSAP